MRDRLEGFGCLLRNETRCVIATCRASIGLGWRRIVDSESRIADSESRIADSESRIADSESRIAD